jgi:hypothetical protein
MSEMNTRETLMRIVTLMNGAYMVSQTIHREQLNGSTGENAFYNFFFQEGNKRTVWAHESCQMFVNRIPKLGRRDA